MSIPPKHKEFAGIALEYIIVSGFGIICALASIGYAAKIYQEKIAKISEHLEISPDQINQEIGDFESW